MIRDTITPEAHKQFLHTIQPRNITKAKNPSEYTQLLLKSLLLLSKQLKMPQNLLQ